jgi:DNA-binding MarR family transcriptional regulator
MTQKNDLNLQASRCSCTALRKASRRISQLYDAALAPSGLKTTQRAILAQVRRSGPTTVGHLAEALIMDAGALAHTLKPLERDRLVSIDVDLEDRRNRVVELTRTGQARLAESDKLWEKAQRGFETAFGQAKSEAATSFGLRPTLVGGALLLTASLTVAIPLSINFASSLKLDPAPLKTTSLMIGSTHEFSFTPEPDDGPVTVTLDIIIRPKIGKNSLR